MTVAGPDEAVPAYEKAITEVRLRYTPDTALDLAPVTAHGAL
jgi:hypothetical protein